MGGSLQDQTGIGQVVVLVPCMLTVVFPEDPYSDLGTVLSVGAGRAICAVGSLSGVGTYSGVMMFFPEFSLSGT